MVVASLLSAVALLAAIAGGLLLLRTVSLRELLLLALRWWRSLADRLHVYQHYKIPRYNDNLQENPLHRKVFAYVGSLPSLEDSDYANLFSTSRRSAAGAGAGIDLYLHLDAGQTVHDVFLGGKISWTYCSGEDFVLRVRKQDKRRILRPYLQHVEAVADEIEFRRREVKLFTNCVAAGDGVRRWKSVPFAHPSTIETLVMDSDLKNRIRSDLESFLKNRAYYHRLGRVWKRSYLLYGPSGTGKSSFVAAMAKFLCYDVYDLDLTRISDRADLKSLLMQTSPRSVIAVEDLDRHLRKSTHSDEVSLTGILNFMDGIFSCCGEERLMVFTMNGKEGIDPAILRPGRLDVHLYFPLCDFTAFKTLASSYLGLKDHKLYPQVEEIFQSGASMSQAEVGELMIANKGSPSRALKTVINALQQSSAGARAGAAAVIGKVGGHRRMGSSGQLSATGRPEDGALSESGATTGNEKGDGAVRKLYSMIRLRSGSRKEEPAPHSDLPPSNSRIEG